MAADDRAACPLCGRASTLVFGRCSECGGVVDGGNLPITQPQTSGGSIWEDVEVLLYFFPSVGILAAAYFVFGLIGLGAVAFVLVLLAASWLWLSEGGW